MHRPVRRLRTWSLALAAVALASLVGALPASANHAWGTYHWARTDTKPFTIQLGDNVTGDWDGHLRSTSSDPNFNDWSDSSVLDTVVVAGRTNPKRCTPTGGRVEVCNSTYGRNGWLGLAQIWLSGNHIVQGVAKMNDTYFGMPAYNNPSEKLHVMCQEVGHTFGLGHTSEDGSSQNTCMDYYYNRTDDGISTRPNQHDYEQLAAIYAHADGTTTIGAAGSALPAAVANAEVDVPAQWGRLVHASPRAAVYIREFPGGYAIATHVTWAEADQGRGR
jgi:hypothetical protein